MMKFVALLLLSAFCCVNVVAQTPTANSASIDVSKSPTLPTAQSSTSPVAPVALKDEPHHHSILENPYVRVYRVEIISPDYTLLHRHDFPYASMSIGHADFTNVVAGKPEVRVQLEGGQLGYSKGGFSHVIRTEKDTPFYNITIELLQSPGEMRSTCTKVAEGPLQGCAGVQIPTDDDAMPSNPVPNVSAKAGPPASPTITLILETDTVAWKTGLFPVKARFSLDVPAPGILLVVAPLSQFKIDFKDGSSQLLSGGDPLWLPPGSPSVITNVSEQKPSALMIFNFKASPNSASN